MNFNWCEFYKIGKSLEKNNKNQAAIRTAISRFYYAIFGHIREFLIKTEHLDENSKKILKSKSGKVHSDIIKIFRSNKMNIDNNNSKKIAKELNKLRIERNKADYNKNIIFKYDDLESSKRTVQIINELLKII